MEIKNRYRDYLNTLLKINEDEGYGLVSRASIQWAGDKMDVWDEAIKKVEPVLLIVKYMLEDCDPCQVRAAKGKEYGTCSFHQELSEAMAEILGEE